jgi:hypothetical protein
MVSSVADASLTGSSRGPLHLAVAPSPPVTVVAKFLPVAVFVTCYSPLSSSKSFAHHGRRLLLWHRLLDA